MEVVLKRWCAAVKIGFGRGVRDVQPVVLHHRKVSVATAKLYSEEFGASLSTICRLRSIAVFLGSGRDDVVGGAGGRAERGDIG